VYPLRGRALALYLSYVSCQMAAGDVVLVTGYPSQLAREVCAEAIRSDDLTRVRALTPSRRLEKARAHIEKLPEAQRRRMVLIEGDACAIDLGLSGAELKSLASEVTRIHHCAGVLHSGIDRAAAERANVGGAKEALEMASQCGRLESLIFHSTAFVSGDRTGVVREDDLEEGQSFRSAIEETHARAEKLMRAAMARLPIVVVRPTTVVGDSRTGDVDHLDGPYLLILLMVTSPPDLALPLPTRGDAPLNLVPVDWVARASVALGRDRRARGRTFHLADLRALTARGVFDLVARALGRPPPWGSIPTGLAKAVLRAPGLERLANSPRAFLETLTTPVTYDARGTDELLPSLGVAACPRLETYVDRLVEHVKERGRHVVGTRQEDLPQRAEEPLG
jgi:thioester reductase-like protein